MKTITRRDFMKLTGAAFGGLLGSNLFALVGKASWNRDDDTQLILDMDAAAIGAQLPLQLKARIYNVTAVIFQSQIILGSGAGVGGTVINGTTAGDDVVTLPNADQFISDVRVTSSIASNLRTGVGVRISGQPYTRMERVYSTGHKYGILSLGAGAEFTQCFAVGNNSHGFVFDSAAIMPQNEIGLRSCQSNTNGGDGFYFTGTGVGIWMDRPVAAFNLGNGIRFSGSWRDIYLSNLELSTNSIRGLDMSEVVGGINLTGLTICGGLIESSQGANIYISPEFSNVSISGLSVNLCHAEGGIVFRGDGLSLSACGFDGNKIAAIRLGQFSKHVAITACTGRNVLGFQAAGVFVDTGAAKFTMGNCDFTTSPTVFAGIPLPAGTKIRGVMGVADVG